MATKKKAAAPAALSIAQMKFLAAFRQAGTITEAAEAAGIHRQRHSEWMQQPAYAAEFADAKEEHADRLEAEAIRAAIEGWEEPVIYQGQLQYTPVLDRDGQPIKDPSDPKGKRILFKPFTVRKKNPTLLMFLNKGARPEKFRDNVKIEHAGDVQHLVDRLLAGRARAKGDKQA